MQQPNPALTYFAKYIENELGIVYAEHNFYQLQNRLEELAAALAIDGADALHQQAMSQGVSGDLRQRLLDIATNNETSFFRDPRIFDTFQSIVLEPAASRMGSEKLRIWSAACSTGQEPLSIAMRIHEFNTAARSGLVFSLFGSDISERVLEKAKSATYSPLESQRGLSPGLLAKYFKQDAQANWVASATLTRDIRYEKVNLKTAFPVTEPFHVIFCRNVLIYQSVESKKEILSRLTSALVPGGHLFMGAGESLLGLSDDYEQEVADGAIAYRKREVSKKSA